MGMLLKNIQTGDILTERELQIGWELDQVYDHLNGEEEKTGTFAEWVREMMEDGDYELIESK